MNPSLDDRLLAELVPVRPVPAGRNPWTGREDGLYSSRWTRKEQEEHWRTLCDAVGAPYARPGSSRPAPAAKPADAPQAA